MNNQQECDFQPIKKIMDVRFGKIELNFDRITGAHYSCKEYFIQSKSQETALTQNLNKRVLAPNLYYVPIANYNIEHFNQFCSKITKLKLFMPIPDEDLKKEIKNRADEKNPFTNMELTFLLYDMVFGLAHLEDIGINHGKFGPEWVARTTTGYAVMEDPVYFELGLNGFYELKKKKDFYLSPEIYQKSAFLQPLEADHDYNKSDVFSAGLVMLEAGNLRRVKGIYQSGKFGEGRLRKLLERFKMRYPDNNLLFSTVKKMVEVDADKRPTFREIRAKLPDYQLVKEHFLDNEDSAPVEDDYGYSQDGSSMRFYNNTNSDISSNMGYGRPVKAQRLGFNNGMSRRPKTPQKGSKKPMGKRSSTPSIAYDKKFVQDVKMRTPQSKSARTPQRLSQSPLHRQYGFNRQNEDKENFGDNRRHTIDPRMNLRREFSPRPSQNTQNRRFSSGPNPQIGTKKPAMRRPSDSVEPPNRVIKNQDSQNAPPMVKRIEEEDITFTPEKPQPFVRRTSEKSRTRYTPIKQPVMFKILKFFLGMEI